MVNDAPGLISPTPKSTEKVSIGPCRSHSRLYEIRQSRLLDKLDSLESQSMASIHCPEADKLDLQAIPFALRFGSETPKDFSAPDLRVVLVRHALRTTVNKSSEKRRTRNMQVSPMETIETLNKHTKSTPTLCPGLSTEAFHCVGEKSKIIGADCRLAQVPEQFIVIKLAVKRGLRLCRH